uniref:Uncharacterized protein n=1 Tax=Psilocybe cubensis TaxID=181762 RepID=A0A8H8CGQ0_PSICU
MSNYIRSLIQNSCLRYFQWQGWTTLAISMMAEGVLQIRIYAMYFHNKTVLVVLLICFGMTSTASATMMALSARTLQPVAIATPIGLTCALRRAPGSFYAYWIPLLCFEGLLCVLALIRGIQMSRAIDPTESREPVQPSFSPLTRGKRVIDMLYRGSIVYFLAIGATFMITIIFWLTLPLGLSMAPLGYCITLPCVIANRLVLSVRGAAQWDTTMGNMTTFEVRVDTADPDSELGKDSGE